MGSSVNTFLEPIRANASLCMQNASTPPSYPIDILKSKCVNGSLWEMVALIHAARVPICKHAAGNCHTLALLMQSATKTSPCSQCRSGPTLQTCSWQLSYFGPPDAKRNKNQPMLSMPLGSKCANVQLAAGNCHTSTLQMQSATKTAHALNAARVQMCKCAAGSWQLSYFGPPDAKRKLNQPMLFTRWACQPPGLPRMEPAGTRSWALQARNTAGSSSNLRRTRFPSPPRNTVKWLGHTALFWCGMRRTQPSCPCRESREFLCRAV